MATLAELLRDRAVVPAPSSSTCNGWSASWAILSDLSFSDLLAIRAHRWLTSTGASSSSGR